MGAKKVLVLLALITILVVIVACQPLPTASTEPTVVSGSSTPSPNVTVIPTEIAAPALEEEDCMAGCHMPDPNEFFAVGAKPQPAGHAGRTTCLECHATLAKPAFPSTHVGRLDASCTVCHTLGLQ